MRGKKEESTLLVTLYIMSNSVLHYHNGLIWFYES